MKNETKLQEGIMSDPLFIMSDENSESIGSSYDKEIARIKEKLLNEPHENLRVFYQKQLEDIVYEKGLAITVSKSIIKAAIKGTAKFIVLCYPYLLKWPDDHRYFQLRTKRRPFKEDVIEELGKSFKSLTCVCKDGVERTFEVKKIEAFLGVGKTRRSIPKKCVNVYF
jgi:hypothetical protein